MNVGCFLRDACFLDHIHRRWTGSNDNNIRGWKFRRVSDLVVVLNWERRRFLTGQLRDIFVDIVTTENFPMSYYRVGEMREKKTYVHTRTLLV